jgi:hypothetical protein
MSSAGRRAACRVAGQAGVMFGGNIWNSPLTATIFSATETMAGVRLSSPWTYLCSRGTERDHASDFGRTWNQNGNGI